MEAEVKAFELRELLTPPERYAEGIGPSEVSAARAPRAAMLPHADRRRRLRHADPAESNYRGVAVTREITKT